MNPSTPTPELLNLPTAQPKLRPQLQLSDSDEDCCTPLQPISFQMPATSGRRREAHRSPLCQAPQQARQSLPARLPVRRRLFCDENENSTAKALESFFDQAKASAFGRIDSRLLIGRCASSNFALPVLCVSPVRIGSYAVAYTIAIIARARRCLLSVPNTDN
jgi:hypothetical protein